ncbi:MAG TPA: hypothetical protein ENJ55_06100, partial [Rhizobiales bacterium]|nr:hypothetical protein [Hyphomicrobiales bacterium]
MTVEALIRSGSRSGGDFQPIGMEEALRTATMWLSPLVHQEPQSVTLCVGRDADFQLASDWMKKIGSKNLFADRALSAANAPKPRENNKEPSLILAFGSGTGRGAADTQAKLARLRATGAEIISFNPVKTGLSVLADQWLGLNPGSDEAVLRVLTGKVPCNFDHLAETGLSIMDMERLLRQLDEHSGKVTVIAGRGVFAHANGRQTSALIEQLGADILPASDYNNCPQPLSNLLNEQCQALVCMGSSLAWHSQSARDLDGFDGRVIALSDKPDGFDTCADLVFCGLPEDNLLTLAGRLGTKGFSDVEGNSPFESFDDYRPMTKIIAARNLPRQSVPEPQPEPDYPFHAITQKPHDTANRAVVFMNANKAKFLGFANKDIVQIESKSGSVRAILALMDNMNENTLWSWGGSLFAPLMPDEEPLQDATTGQPAWFDLKV